MPTSTAISRESAPPTTLPTYLRYKDLVAHNVVRSWAQLLRLIDQQDFPSGVMLSPNVRAWTVQEVDAWLTSRPTKRKVPPPVRPGNKPRGNPRRKQAEAAE
jgi:predicted DNA-binding transcriptional regulator AlpA